ncbi:MAG TPA: hypothetical protein VGF32_08195 [Streptosporangiaceae bacterium]
MTAGWTAPGQRWRLLAPHDAVVVRLTPGPLGVRRATARLRGLHQGAPVVLLDSRPGARLRTRRVAATGVITVDRQYLALPSLRSAIVVAEDTPDALSWALRSLVTPPPGVTWAHSLADLVVRLLRRLPAVTGWLSAGWIIVGRRA